MIKKIITSLIIGCLTLAPINSEASLLRLFHLADKDNVNNTAKVDSNGSVSVVSYDISGNEGISIIDADGTKADVKTNTNTESNELLVKLENHLCEYNSTSEALGIGGVFLGSWQYILNYSEIRVSVITDQNSAEDGLEIQWSEDGETEIDGVEDSFSILANKGKTFSTPRNWPYFRIKYTNGGTAQGSFNLVSMVDKVASKGSMHRIYDSIVGQDDAILTKSTLTGLDPNDVFQNIKSTEGGSLSTNLVDNYGFTCENTPMSELRVATPTRLVGSSFTGTTIDTNFWTTAVTGTGTATQANSQVVLATGTTANSTTSITSIRKGRYTGGSSMRYRAVIQLTDGETGTVNNVRRWGVYDANDGAFFQLDGTTLSVVTRKATNDTVVTSANWNGKPFTIDLSAHTYEIYWTNSKVWFVVGDDIIHTVNATSTTWAASMSLSIKAENFNKNGLGSNILLGIRVQTIYRLGELDTQPTSKYQAGTTAGLVLKYGAGNLHGAVISGVSNNSIITLYDNIAASGTIIWSSGAMGSQTQPFALDFHSLPFSNGLTLVISAANSNITVIYE